MRFLPSLRQFWSLLHFFILQCHIKSMWQINPEQLRNYFFCKFEIHWCYEVFTIYVKCLTPVSLLDLKKECQHLMFSLKKKKIPESKIMKTRKSKVSFILTTMERVLVVFPSESKGSFNSLTMSGVNLRSFYRLPSEGKQTNTGWMMMQLLGHILPFKNPAQDLMS